MLQWLSATSIPLSSNSGFALGPAVFRGKSCAWHLQAGSKAFPASCNYACARKQHLLTSPADLDNPDTRLESAALS